MFQVNNLQEFQSQVGVLPEIRFQDQLMPDGTPVVIACYMISGKETFSTDARKECRGITFHKNTGEVISRPFHKFFNEGETPETQWGSLDFSSLERIMDKRDGSMLSTVFGDSGQIYLKSKKSFTSPAARKGTSFLNNNTNYINFIKEVDQRLNATLIFEYTSPVAQIVLHYDKEELVLLNAREKNTGEYLIGNPILLALCAKYDIPIVEHYNIDNYDFINKHQTLIQLKEEEGIEGKVFVFKNTFVKVKTSDYCDKHHVLTALSSKRVAILFLEDKLDDLLSNFADEPDTLKIINTLTSGLYDVWAYLEDKVKSAINQMTDPSLVPTNKAHIKDWYVKISNNHFDNNPKFDSFIKEHLLIWFKFDTSSNGGLSFDDVLDANIKKHITRNLKDYVDVTTQVTRFSRNMED